MNHHKIIGITFFLLLCITGCTSAATKISGTAKMQGTEKNVEAVKKEEISPTPSFIPTPTPKPTPTPVPTCDGVNITSGCEVDGVKYSTYIYHPAVAEQSHIETSTTTSQVQVGTCTLCKDGSWSPTCAVGRGACSHHGGVAQYNAPKYANQTNTVENKVIDVPATEAYYETVLSNEN